MISNILASQLFIKFWLLVKAILITSNPLARYPIHEAIQKNKLCALMQETKKIDNLNDISFLNKQLQLPIDIIIENNYYEMLEWLIINNKLDKNIPYHFLEHFLKMLEYLINTGDDKIVKLLQLNDITYDNQSINQIFPLAQNVQNAHREITIYKNAVQKGKRSAFVDAINKRGSEFNKLQWLTIALLNNHHQQVLHAVLNNYFKPLEIIEGLIFYKNLPCDMAFPLLFTLNENEIKMLKKLAQENGNKKIVDTINDDQNCKLMNKFNDHFDIKFILNKQTPFHL